MLRIFRTYRLVMACKLLVMAEERWCQLNAPHLLPLVQAKVKFVDGIQPRPQVNFDETRKQLIKETRQPLPAQPGQPQRYDDEYECRGATCGSSWNRRLAAAMCT